MPLHGQKFGVGCAITATWIVRIIIFWTILEQYVSDIPQPFLRALQKKKKTYVYFMQDDAAHSATCPIIVLQFKETWKFV
jgi:hypothetical protein